MGKSGKEMSAMERYWHNQKQRAKGKDKTRDKKPWEKDKKGDGKGENENSHKNPYAAMNNNSSQNEKHSKPFDDSKNPKFANNSTNKNDGEKKPDFRRDT